MTDAGLKELAALKNLAELSLTGTMATSAGIASLREALPNCQITDAHGMLARGSQKQEVPKAEPVTMTNASWWLIGVGAVLLAVAVLWAVFFRARHPKGNPKDGS